MHWHHLISALLAVLRVDALVCVAAVSERSVRKCLLLFLAIRLLVFPTGAVSVQGLLLPGPDQSLGGHRASAPRASGCCSMQGRPSLYSVHLGLQPAQAAVPPEACVGFPIPLTVQSTGVVTLCTCLP